MTDQTAPETPIAPDFPFCVTVTKPGHPTVYLGFAYASQAEAAAHSLTSAMLSTAHPAGTTITSGPTPEGIAPLPPVPTDPSAIAESADFRAEHNFPDLYSRLVAQEGYDAAGRLWLRASNHFEWANTPEESEPPAPVSVPGEAAEIEQLRAELATAREELGYQVSEGYEKGWEHGVNAGMKRAAQPGTVTLPDTAASLIAAFLTSARGVTQLRPWEEVADRLVEYMRESWRPVPAEAGDSAADESAMAHLDRDGEPCRCECDESVSCPCRRSASSARGTEADAPTEPAFGCSDAPSAVAPAVTPDETPGSLA